MGHQLPPPEGKRMKKETEEGRKERCISFYSFCLLVAAGRRMMMMCCLCLILPRHLLFFLPMSSLLTISISHVEKGGREWIPAAFPPDELYFFVVAGGRRRLFFFLSAPDLTLSHTAEKAADWPLNSDFP